MLLILIACIPVLFALVKPGFFITHDGEFNLVRLMHFYNELANGQFPVRWAYGLNYGFGSPLFTFFYPLTYYLGSTIHFFGPDFGSSLKILIGVATVSSVLLMYAWLRRHFGRFAALFGTLIFLYAPFRLLTMYVTGSYGVLLSLMFLPLIFLSIDRIALGKKIFLPLLAVGVFGLLTAHNVTALILLPAAIVYGLAVVTQSKARGRVVREIGGGILLGFALAAFFLIPALSETKLVFLSQGIAVNFRDHFPTLKQLIYSKWGYFYSVLGTNDEMSFQVGAAQWAVWGLAGLMLKKKSFFAILFFSLFSVSILMMLPASLFIWGRLPVLAQIQFPWRILVASISFVPFLGAYLAERKFGKVLAVLLLGLLFWGNRNNLRTWETIRYPDSSYLTRIGLYNGSTDIAWETRPIFVNLPPTWLATHIVEDNPALMVEGQVQKGYGDIEVSLTATKSATLVLNRFYYPVWKVTLDGKETESRKTEPKGLLSLVVSAGKHEIKVSYQKTKTEAVADLVSIVGTIVLVYLFLTTSRRSKR